VISLVGAAMRLAAVVTLMVWLPGSVASALPVRRWRALHSLIIGSAIHLVALVLTSFATARMDRALWLLPVFTAAVALTVRTFLRAPSETDASLPVVLDRWGAAAVGALVTLAGVLRWLHNYHYDDLQHLFYLSELSRTNTLFPSQFLLELSSLDLPAVGSGNVLLSRYPYWAVSNVLLARLARIGIGDAYYLLALGVLAIILGQITALVSAAWCRRSGVFWTLTIVATSPFVADNLLNYGGYPFQVGKLFVLLAATATVVAWRTNDRASLVSVAVGLFVAPLLHTNNVIGVACVVVLLLPLLYRPAMRRPVASTLAAVAALAIVVAGSVATDGFMRWVTPAEAAEIARSSSSTTAGGSLDPASDQGPAVTSLTNRPADFAVGSPANKIDQVARRILLFIARGLPWEAFILVVAAILAPSFSRFDGLGERFAPFALAAMSLLVAGAFTAALGRQLITSVLKPGYLRQRAALIQIAPEIDANRPVVTDPITAVFGRAAGWPVAGAPPLAIEDQARLILLHHPAVTGNALRALLSAVLPATVIINEQVAGARTSEKFQELGDLRELARSGPDLQDLQDTTRQAAALVEDIYELNFPAIIGDARSYTRALFTTSWSRPIVVFGPQGEFRAHVPVGRSAYGPLLRGSTSAAQMRAEPFLSSVLVTLPPSTACTSGVELKFQNRASFGGSLMVWALDDLPAIGTHYPPVQVVDLATSEASTTLPFAKPVCDSRPLTLLAHFGYWWDFRFDITSAAWKLSAPPE
jgi:hypothetical protein